MTKLSAHGRVTQLGSRVKSSQVLLSPAPTTGAVEAALGQPWSSCLCARPSSAALVGVWAAQLVTT